MVLRLNGNLNIDNLRNYPAGVVDALRCLLAEGALASADPRHEHFFELEDASRVYYVYAAPERSKVFLLAAWPKGELDRAAD